MKLNRFNSPSNVLLASVRGNPRALFAVGLLGLSLIAAVAITAEANRSVAVWSASGDLTVGDVVTASDIAKTKVMLPENSPKYLSISAKIIGSVIVRRVGVGELIPTASLASSGSALLMRSVPFRIAKNDLPSDLARGQIVDLYALPTKELNSSSLKAAALIAHGVSVESIDIKARDIGGEIGIVLRIAEKDILSILDSTSNSRAVVVRSAI